MEACLVPASPDRSYRRAMTSTHATRRVDLPAAVGTLGALGFTAVGLLQAIDPSFPGEPAFAVRTIPSAISALLMAGSVVALHRSGVAGTGRFVRIGLAAAALGWVADAAAQLISQAKGVDYPPPYILATALLLFGMLPAAVAVLREGAWSGWRRWTPLVTVLYLAAASPLFATPGALANLAGALWGACWIALGAALLRGTARRG
jgi:hypothetical protein